MFWGDLEVAGTLCPPHSSYIKKLPTNRVYFQLVNSILHSFSVLEIRYSVFKQQMTTQHIVSKLGQGDALAPMKF